MTVCVGSTLKPSRYIFVTFNHIGVIIPNVYKYINIKVIWTQESWHLRLDHFDPGCLSREPKQQQQQSQLQFIYRLHCTVYYGFDSIFYSEKNEVRMKIKYHHYVFESTISQARQICIYICDVHTQCCLHITLLNEC